jgi:hypothetical protein
MRRIFMKNKLNLLYIVSICNFIAAMDTAPTKEEMSLATLGAIKAIDIDSVDYLKLALFGGADISYYNPTTGNHLLLKASKENKPNTALYLVEQPYFQTNSVINEQNAYGETVLFAASFHGNKPLVEKLLAIPGINPDLKQKSHEHTALHEVAYKGKDNLITLLVEHGADPTIQDCHLATPVFDTAILANENLSPKTISTIMAKTDAYKNTQLHLLAMAEIGEMAKERKQTIKEMLLNMLAHLIKLGADIWGKNVHNQLSIEVCYEKYLKLCKKYRKNKVFYLQNSLANQEEVLHIFLRFYTEQAQGAPIIISSGCDPLELNIESTLAHNDDQCYYNFTLEFKDKLKQEMRNNPDHIKEVWKIDPLAYTPPAILETKHSIQ